MDSTLIKYRFHFEAGDPVEFKLELHNKSMQMIFRELTLPPEWAKLETHKCPHCPLSAEEFPYCPAAANLSQVSHQFDKIVSHDELDVEVILPTRTIVKKTSAQEAICSLFGLLISCSGCPHTTFFKVMGRYHLPFATDEETVCRATSFYLLTQFLRAKLGKPHEFGLDGLKKIYDNIQIVNKYMAMRLRSAVETDATVNAIVILDSLAHAASLEIDGQLEFLSQLFESYVHDK